MRALSALLLGLVVALCSQSAFADDAADAGPEVKAAIRAVGAALQSGPADIRLLDRATLHLPADYAFVPKAETDRLMKAFGNTTDPERIGMVIQPRLGLASLILIDFHKTGYVRDDEAKNWNADDLLKSLREGTESANAEREKQGIPALDIAGWVEKPAYDSATHRLVWSMAARDRDGPVADDKTTINYNTYALGRDGFIELTLVTDRASIEATKPTAKAILAAVAYEPGKSYTDFDAGTDRVAAFGIAALVAGVAAKKIGLLAGLGVMLLKFWKGGALLLAGGMAALRRLFKRRPGPQNGAPETEVIR